MGFDIALEEIVRDEGVWLGMRANGKGDILLLLDSALQINTEVFDSI